MRQPPATPSPPPLIPTVIALALKSANKQTNKSHGRDRDKFDRLPSSIPNGRRRTDWQIRYCGPIDLPFIGCINNRPPPPPNAWRQIRCPLNWYRMVRFAFPPNLCWNTFSLKGHQLNVPTIQQCGLSLLGLFAVCPFLASLSRSSSQTEYSKSETFHATHLSLRFWTWFRHLLFLGQILQSCVNFTAGFTQPSTRHFPHLYGMSALGAAKCCNLSYALVIWWYPRFCSYSFIVSSFA